LSLNRFDQTPIIYKAPRFEPLKNQSLWVGILNGTVHAAKLVALPLHQVAKF